MEHEHERHDATKAAPDGGGDVGPAAGVKRAVKVLVIMADPVVDVRKDDVLQDDEPEGEALEAHLDGCPRQHEGVFEGVVGIVCDGGGGHLQQQKGWWFKEKHSCCCARVIREKSKGSHLASAFTAEHKECRRKQEPNHQDAIFISCFGQFSNACHHEGRVLNSLNWIIVTKAYEGSEGCGLTI